MTRNDGRNNNQIRPVEFVLDYVDYPEGSVLISIGNTRVLCNVSIENQVPAWMEKSDLPGGWITAEYALLPRSTTIRVRRETQGLRSLLGQEVGIHGLRLRLPARLRHHHRARCLLK